VAGELNTTGQKLLTAHMGRSLNLVLIHRCTQPMLFGYGCSAGPIISLSLWWQSNDDRLTDDDTNELSPSTENTKN